MLSRIYIFKDGMVCQSFEDVTEANLSLMRKGRLRILAETYDQGIKEISFSGEDYQEQDDMEAPLIITTRKGEKIYLVPISQLKEK